MESIIKVIGVLGEESKDDQSVLSVNSSLTINESLYSNNKKYRLTLETNGNLVLYKKDKELEKIFSQKRNQENKGFQLIMERSGQLSLTIIDGTFLKRWPEEAAKDSNERYFRLFLGNDGILEIQERID